VAHRRQAEAELARSLEDVSKIMQANPDIIYMLDDQIRLVRWNHKLESVTGFTAAELAGRLGTEFFPPNERPVIEAAIAEALRVGYADVEANLVTKAGPSIPYQFTGAPLKNEQGEVVGLVGVGRDISDSKLAARLRASLREKETLVTELHHRVKNNLQVITSLVNLQAAHIGDPIALRMFREIQNRVRLMANIHDALYRSESLLKLDAAQFFPQLARDLLRVHAVDPARVHVRADVESIELGLEVALPCAMIMNELVTNALEHAFPGQRSGEVTIRIRRSGAQHCVLEVRDDGIGLPESPNWDTVDTVGWQLVAALVAQLDGVLESKTERGTTFTMIFPLPQAASESEI
jgi:PAS domain S-box-containing protein